MKNTQTHLELIVTRDGEPDATYARQERTRAFLAAFKVIGGYIADYATGVAHNVAEDISLGVFDAIHETHLYQQKYEAIEQEKIARKMGSIGLL